jgi:hypothetical protein
MDLLVGTGLSDMDESRCDLTSARKHQWRDAVLDPSMRTTQLCEISTRSGKSPDGRATGTKPLPPTR